MQVWTFIVDNIFRNPPILMGLVATLGSILLQKKWNDILKAAVLAAVGMLMINVGVDLLSQSITPVNIVFRAVNGVELPVGLDAASFSAEFGGDIGMAMLLGMVIHLLIARFTPVKTIFLTGHFLYWIPFTFVAAGLEAGFDGVALIVFGAIFAALYWSFMPWVMRKYVWAVTGDESWMIGHPTGMLSMIAGTVSRFVGDKRKSTEDLKIPESLSFLKDVNIISVFVIAIMYIILDVVFAGGVTEYSQRNIVFYALQMGITFAVGLQILLAGVRMLINQIVPAFEGISRKLVPNAKPAYDVPMIFPYRPNALIIGFVIGLLASVPSLLIINYTGLFGLFVVPLVFKCFFELGTAAIIADGQGGLRGTIIGTAVAAFVMMFFAGYSVMIFDNTIQNLLLSSGGDDKSVFGSIAYWIGILLNSIGIG